MKIHALIQQLRADLLVYGDLPVRVETADNQLVRSTLRATYSGESTLFLMLEGGEAE